MSSARLKVFHPTPGQSEVQAAELAFVKILKVTRTDKVHALIPKRASIDEYFLLVRYHMEDGRLSFDEKVPFEPGETVQVVYKRGL